jgi:hypothetical protein
VTPPASRLGRARMALASASGLAASSPPELPAVSPGFERCSGVPWLVMSAPGEPPYLRQLRAVALGEAPKLSADAIKQHYVPSFLLARRLTKPWAFRARPSGRSATVSDEAAPLVGRSGAEMEMIVS